MNNTNITPPQNKIVRIVLCVFAVMLTAALLLYLFDIITEGRFMVAGGRSNSGITFPKDIWIIVSWVTGAVLCWWAVFRVQHSEHFLNNLNKKISDDPVVFQVFRVIFGVSAGIILIGSLFSIRSLLALGFDTFSVLVAKGPIAIIIYAALWGAFFVHVPESRRRMRSALISGLVVAFGGLLASYSNVLTTGADLGEQVSQNFSALMYIAATILAAVVSYCYARFHSR